VGLFNIILLWPFFFVLNATGVEPFEFPSQKVMGELILNGLIGTCLSDYLWLLSMLMTSPVVVTLGLSLTIPLAMGADSFQGKFDATPSYWAGTVLVLAAFLVINLGGYFVSFDNKASRLWQKLISKIRCRS
jgi:solute carrier family 35 protein F5